jgi:4-hydroxy-3-polyprenylbenzoate decarboxylase
MSARTNPSSDKKIITLAMTGGSGAAYGFRLLECLLSAGCQVDFLISDAARQVVQMELQIDLPVKIDQLQKFLEKKFKPQSGQLTAYDKMDWLSPVASGTSRNRQMVICPASGGSISAIAHGASKNLIERAADVAIKEKYPLIVVPREMPLSAIHLENLLSLARLGVTVMPASPGFYHEPRSINDLVDFVVGRILQHLGLDQRLVPPWGESSGTEP